MAFIRTIPPRKATGELAEVYRTMAEVAGANLVPNVVRVFSLKPASMRRMIRLWELSVWSGEVPRTTRELLASAVSQLNDCHYCTDAHEAFLEAAGGDRNRAAKLLAGRAADATPLEEALIALARKANAQAKLLSPDDLESLRALAGDDALDYALVVAGFHFANRMADLLDIDSELLPEALRGLEPLRQVGNRMAVSLFRRTMDLRIRPYEKSYEEALDAAAPVIERVLGRPLKEEFELLRARPKLVEAVRLMLEERESTTLDKSVLARVHRTVEEALPSRPEDIQGLHARPTDPVEAFAFVGTRYAHRSSRPMIDALRQAGYDDTGILDLAIAIAHANQWARLHRLTGLPPAIGYVV